MRPFVLAIASVAALGGLLFGYDTGVISGAVLFITRDFGLSTRTEELTVSIVLIGAMVGSIAAGPIADRIGRRTALAMAAIVFTAGALLSAAAPAIEVLLVARVIVGIAIGLSSVVAPLYISEVAPPQARGALVSLYQFAITIGILLSFLLDFALAGSGAWRWMLGLAVVPSLFLAGGMAFLPESPRYLFKVGRVDDARGVLRKVAGDDALEREASAILASLTQAKSGFELLGSATVRYALAAGVTLAVLQQVTGINTVIYYGPEIFRMASVSSDKASILATALVGVVNVAMTLVATFFVDRVGRKPLLYAGVAGMGLALSALAYAFSRPTLDANLAAIAMGSLMIYVGSFAYSLGPIVWLLIAEIFPLPARALGMSACTLANWFANFLVSRYFLTMIHKLGRAETFAVYAVLCAVTIAFVARFLPETKRQPLEDIRVGS